MNHHLVVTTRNITKRFGDEQAWIAKPQLIQYLLGIWCRSPKSAGGYMVQAFLTFGGVPQGSQASTQAFRTLCSNQSIRTFSCTLDAC